MFNISALCDILRLFSPDNFLVKVVATVAWFINGFSPKLVITEGPRAVIVSVKRMQCQVVEDVTQLSSQTRRQPLLRCVWQNLTLLPVKETSHKQDNVHTNTESVQCISTVYSICPCKYNQ